MSNNAEQQSHSDESEGDKLENLICSLGQFGRYQMYVLFLASIGSFTPAMVVVAMTFLAYEPPHRCLVSACEDQFASYNESYLSFTTPYNDAKHTWDQCKMYSYNGSDPVSLDTPTSDLCSPDYFFENSTSSCSNGYIFDPSLFRSSIVTDFNLFCSSPWLTSLSGIVYMVGMLFGAIILGDLADRIGRRNALVVSCALLGVSGAVGAISNSYYLFLAARALTGAGAVGLFQITFVLAVEFIGAKYRAFVGIMIETPFALGEATTGVLAYFIRDWRYLQAAVTVPALLLISFRWLMPESVRWLVSQNRSDEAIEQLYRVAKVNKKELTEDKLQFIRNKDMREAKYKTFGSSTVDLVTDNSATDATPSTPMMPKKTILDLLRTPNMRARSLNMFFCWASVTFMYYGLSLNSTNLGGNIFVSFILTMLIEIPSYIFSWLTLDRMGRKGTLMLMFWLGGISCIIAGVLDSEQVGAKMAFSLIGKFGAAAAFAIVYVYASEIFPTDYRGVGVGACSMFARVGGIMAPLIVELFKKTPAVAPIIFGVIGVVCGLLVILLPETVGTRLPQTLEESENFGTDQSKLDCCYCFSRRRRRTLVST